MLLLTLNGYFRLSSLAYHNRRSAESSDDMGGSFLMAFVVKSPTSSTRASRETDALLFLGTVVGLNSRFKAETMTDWSNNFH